MSEVGSARKRGLRALLSVRSPVPSATARVYSWLGRTRRVCTPERGKEKERENARKRETDREGEDENETGREGDGSVSSRAGCCIGQARVARGSWPMAQVVPTAKRGPWPPSGKRKREAVCKIGGVDSAKESKGERERESPGGGRAERVLPRTITLPCLLVEAPPKGSYSFFLSLSSSPLFSRSPARSYARARTHARARG